MKIKIFDAIAFCISIFASFLLIGIFTYQWCTEIRWTQGVELCNTGAYVSMTIWSFVFKWRNK